MQELFGDLRRQNCLQGLSADAFVVQGAHFLATLNAVHPFREGNGRAQTSFLLLLADHAGYPLNLEKLDPERFMEAMVASFGNNEELLRRGIESLIQKHP